ncbi:MAG: hypothetical protein JOY71_19265 [Acetobacteraceae bacterium]|nr:hypothetical protein [Acetobacteraceae bacterium]MBV8524235.1 hypothetical protein [Acetobacteraceae bacterium]
MTLPSLPDASRREILAGFAALTAEALFSRAGLAAGSPTLPPLPQGQAVGSEQFLALSQWLTGHQDLDRSFGDALRSAFLEVGLADGLANLYRTAATLPVNPNGDGKAVVDGLQKANVLDVATTVLRGWYVGRVQQPSGKDITVAYEPILLGKVVADFANLPSFCGGETGFWAQPPKLADIPLQGEARQ